MRDRVLATIGIGANLGEPQAARTLMAAIEQVTADPALHTRDLGGNAKTADVTAAMCARIAG